MMPQLKKLIEQGRAIIKGMSTKARITAAMLIVAVAGGLIYLMSVDHTSYAPLFTGLSNEDAGKIIEELRQRKTPFKIESGGTAILVPEAKVHEIRLDLAGKGLPKGGGVGFEIFDTQKFGISDFAQQINYRRALQGELERTITQLDAVKTARVHIAMPKQQIFARKKEDVSAAVTLRLHSGRALSHSSVQAIVHLVSSSVTSLTPEQITVVTTSGELLWSGRGGMGGGSSPIELKTNIEESLERRVNEILNAALGSGHSVVKVTADVAMTQVEQEDTEFEPEKTAIRSESLLEENNQKSGNHAAGIPGVHANLPGGPSPTGGVSKDGSYRKRETRNYEVNKVVRRKVSPPGELERLSVAVLVDSYAVARKGAASGAAKGKGGRKKSAMAVDLKALEELVKKAVGFSADRGDLVTLQSVPFAKEAEIVEPLTATIMRYIKDRNLWLSPLIAIGVLILIISLWRRLKKIKNIEVIDFPKTVRELENESGAKAKGGEETKEIAGPDQVEKLLSSGSNSARDLAAAAVEHDAARAASVLRSWLAEDRNA